MTESIREKTHSFLEINSYSISQGLINFNVGAFGAYVFFFYETEIQMNIILLGILFVTYSIWDAINEPLLGNITDKPSGPSYFTSGMILPLKNQKKFETKSKK